MIGQSGFGSVTRKLSGGLNDTDESQRIYDLLVLSTRCAHLHGSQKSLDCLRNLPGKEILVAALQVSGSSGAVLDGDFLQNHITTQMETGKFVKVPLLAGTNSDETTDLRVIHSDHYQFIDKDEDFEESLVDLLRSDEVEQHKAKEYAAELMKLYPNDQSVEIPSLETWPHVLRPGDPYARQLGAQCRRLFAIWGDLLFHYSRRRANMA